MLAVFDQSVAKSPEGQKNSQSRASGSALKDGLLVRHFNSLHPDAVSFNHGVSSFMAFSSDKQNPLLPRLFAAVDDTLCLFQGHIENIAPLKQLYGLTKTANEDAGGSVPLFWGADSEDCLVLSDDAEVVKKECGGSFAPFPQGCFFTSAGGLQSFEHPLKELKPVPWVDGTGQTCGSTFVVVQESRNEATAKTGESMPRVGSDADWSSHY